MNATIKPLSEGWVPLGVLLGRPANRKATDRGKRSVAELAGHQMVQRDGFYRPEDGAAEFLYFWAATSRGWSQVNAFAWNAETGAWEPVERSGPRPD